MTSISTRRPARVARAGTVAACLLLLTLAATECWAQSTPAPKPAEEPGFFESIGRWFGRQADNFHSSLQDAGKNVKDFGHEAGVAAKTTVEGARDAADVVAKIPTARVISGHETCQNAPNGAPDCLAAATAMCKAKGFSSGKSADMTTAEVCEPKVYLAGRNSGPGCHTETFVSRALCQ